MKTEKYYEIKDMLENKDYLVKDLVNEINSLNGSFENFVLYDMDNFNEIMEGYTPMEISQKIYFGDFNPNADYFYFNGYANLESIHESELREHFEIIIDELIDELIYHYPNIYIDDDELKELIDEYVEEIK